MSLGACHTPALITKATKNRLGTWGRNASDPISILFHKTPVIHLIVGVTQQVSNECAEVQSLIVKVKWKVLLCYMSCKKNHATTTVKLGPFFFLKPVINDNNTASGMSPSVPNSMKIIVWCLLIRSWIHPRFINASARPWRLRPTPPRLRPTERWRPSWRGRLASGLTSWRAGSTAGSSWTTTPAYSPTIR